MKIVAIIQARLESTRFPNKCMQTVGGIPMVKRVWNAAKHTADEVVVAWPERYPDLDQNNVLERFRRIAKEKNADIIIRLTSDCPLITQGDIWKALVNFHGEYYSNHKDGKDVQVFTRQVLDGDEITHKEHVIADFTTVKLPYGPRSVDTKEDLEYVRLYNRAR